MDKVILAVLFCFVCSCPLAPRLEADDTLIETLQEAIETLDQQASYRWTSEVDVPEETRFRPGPTSGTTERDGVTHVTLSFGPRTTHVVIEGEKAAVTNRDGRWETVSMLDQGYRSEGYSAATARRVQPPVEEAFELIATLTSVEATGDVIVGTLPTVAVQTRLANRRVDEVRDARGTVKFWINEGRLSRYVWRGEGTIVNDGQTRAIWQQTTTDISDIGTATVELPPGAREALNRSVPQPQPRLSDAEATALLERRGKREVGVHDPSSFVRCDDEYWFFSTGTGVSSWHSENLRDWKRGPRVFPEMPQWVTDVVSDQRGHFWAPDVIRIDDRYLLYYSVSSFGKNTSAIALASSPTLNPEDPAYEWTDHGIVIQSGHSDNFNAIDPAVIRTEAGELWMSFGSFWSGLQLIELDPRSGKRVAENAPIHSLASKREIEAPHIYQRDGWFYLFVNWGKCCRGVDSTYNIRVGRSRQITGPYLDKDGVDMAEGGGSLLLESEGPFIGPGHANVLREGDRYLLSCHFYDGTERGRSMLSIQELTWSKDGWPTIAATESPDRDTPASD